MTEAVPCCTPTAHRSKNRWSLVTAWSKVVGAWCSRLSSSGVSTPSPPCGPAARRSIIDGHIENVYRADSGLGIPIGRRDDGHGEQRGRRELGAGVDALH